MRNRFTAATLGLLLTIALLTGCNQTEKAADDGPPVKARAGSSQAEIAGGAASC